LRKSWNPLRRSGGRASFRQNHNRKVRDTIPFSHPPTNSLSENRYDHLAHKNNAILIPCCGFDSVPADLVVYLANKTAKSVLGPSAYIEDSVSLYQLKGGPSGGTLATVISSFEEMATATAEASKDFSYRERELVHPLSSGDSFVNSYTAKGAPTKPAKLIQTVSVGDKTWYGGTFFMCTINRPVVQHTWSLFKRSRDRHPENVYGDNFTYSEIAAKPKYHQAALYVLALYAFLAGILFPPVSASPVGEAYVLTLTSLKTRWVLKRILPQPGTGPSPYAPPPLPSERPH